MYSDDPVTIDSRYDLLIYAQAYMAAAVNALTPYNHL